MKPYRLRCTEIWGGIGAIDQNVETEGLAASIYCAAAGGGRGGDIYYLSVCSKDVITRIAVADVMGHGEGVALVSSWVYEALQARMDSQAGDGVLSDLNSTICARGFEAMTTAAVLSHNINGSSLHFCYAGHPPAILWHKANGWCPLENSEERDGSNMALGVLDSAFYEQGHVPLSAGDRVVMFTDGLLDAEDLHGEPFEVKRLLQMLQSEGDTSTERIKRAIVDGLAGHKRGLAMEDDVTILVAEVR